MLRDFAFIDIEASGLHATSYPVSVAWCGFDLQPVEYLIRPLEGWGVADWNPESEAVHGIARQRLIEEGVSAPEVATAFNKALAGRFAVSDAPEFDAPWAGRLFRDTDVRKDFRISGLDRLSHDISGLFDPFCVRRNGALMARLETFYPHTHKASDDCLRLAAMWRMMLDRDWAAWLLARPLPSDS
jgi:hypothetical protein